MRVLTEDDVKRLITMEEAIRASRIAYSELSKGAANVPLRHHVKMKGEDVGLVMSGYMTTFEAYGVKVVSVVPENKQRALPTTLGVMLLLDPITGMPLALMDGTYLTALRTGAGTGVATDILANPDAKDLAIIGTGGQAAAHVEAVLTVRDVKTILVYNRTTERAEHFARERVSEFTALRPDVQIRVVNSAQEAVEGADIIVCSTNSSDPVVHAKWLREGAHVNATGAHAPHMQEIAADVVQRASKIVVDTYEGALVPGDLSVPIRQRLASEHDLVEVGQIILGHASGRENRSEITLFKSVGHASQDLITASKILEMAIASDAGVMVDL